MRGGNAGPSGSVEIRVQDGLGPQLARAGADTTNLPRAPIDLESLNVDSAREGVVQLRSEGRDDVVLGSGWVVRPGLVVTNHHVISDARRAKRNQAIDHTGTARSFKVVADDPANDLALVSVPGLRDQPLAMDDVVEVGEDAVVSGYPDGMFWQAPARALTGGRMSRGPGDEQDTIIFGGYTRPGGSGGAVINGSGEVVGTTSAAGTGSIPPGYVGPIVATVPNDAVRALLERSGVR